MPRRLLIVLAGVASVLSLSLGSADSASAAQRIDMKVLLLGTSTSEPDFAAWQAALQREGVPFEAIVTLARARPDHRRDALGHARQRHPGGQVPGDHRFGRGASRMHRIRLRVDPLDHRMDGD